MSDAQPTSKKFAQLYHYTTVQGAVGIIESQTLWNTDLNFLNDSSEGKIARQKFEHVVYPALLKEIHTRIQNGHMDGDAIKKLGTVEDLVRHEVLTLVDVCYRSMGGAFYVTSLCGEEEDSQRYEHRNGRLSQWRGYGSDGGVAIVFTTEKLEALLSIECQEFALSMGLGDIFYDFDGGDKSLQEEADALLNDFVDFAMYQIKRVYFQEEPENSEEIVHKGYNAIINCITRYKHESFKEENEVRLYSHRLKPPLVSEGMKSKPLKFRGNAIPYIELFTSDDIQLPIERIIVGPHQEKERRAEGLRTLLKEKDIQAEVLVSETPYVG